MTKMVTQHQFQIEFLVKKNCNRKD